MGILPYGYIASRAFVGFRLIRDVPDGEYPLAARHPVTGSQITPKGYPSVQRFHSPVALFAPKKSYIIASSVQPSIDKEH